MKLEFTHNTITKSDVRKIRGLLEDVMRAASLEDASFDAMHTGTEQTVTLNLQRDVTAFIREQVKIHHSSWILRPLKILSNELERFES